MEYEHDYSDFQISIDDIDAIGEMNSVETGKYMAVVYSMNCGHCLNMIKTINNSLGEGTFENYIEERKQERMQGIYDGDFDFFDTDEFDPQNPNNGKNIKHVPTVFVYENGKRKESDIRELYRFIGVM